MEIRDHKQPAKEGEGKNGKKKKVDSWNLFNITSSL